LVAPNFSLASCPALSQASTLKSLSNVELLRLDDRVNPRIQIPRD
jgi:hypothetical protein